MQNNIHRVEGAGRGNQLEKDDHVYASQKFLLPPMINCSMLHDWCLLNPDVRSYYCPQPNKDLHSITSKSGNSKIDSLP